MIELLQFLFESMSTSLSGVMRRLCLTADIPPEGRYRFRGVWVVRERTIGLGRDMRLMAGIEENLEGVGVVERFSCSLFEEEVAVLVEVGEQSTDAERSRLKNCLRGKRSFFEGALKDACSSCNGEAPWTSVEVGLALTGWADGGLGCGRGGLCQFGIWNLEKKGRAEGRGRGQ